MAPLTPAEQLSYNQCSTCHICEKSITSKQSLADYDDQLKTMKADKSIRWKRRDPINLGPKGFIIIFFFFFKYILIFQFVITHTPQDFFQEEHIGRL